MISPFNFLWINANKILYRHAYRSVHKQNFEYNATARWHNRRVRECIQVKQFHYIVLQRFLFESICLFRAKYTVRLIATNLKKIKMAYTCIVCAPVPDRARPAWLIAWKKHDSYTAHRLKKKADKHILSTFNIISLLILKINRLKGPYILRLSDLKCNKFRS